MKILKFTRGYQSYGVRDIAGFNDEIAAFLIKEKYAEQIGEREDESDVPPRDVKHVFQIQNPPKLKPNICAICGKDYKNMAYVKKHLWEKHKIK